MGLPFLSIPDGLELGSWVHGSFWSLGQLAGREAGLDQVRGWSGWGGVEQGSMPETGRKDGAMWCVDMK